MAYKKRDILRRWANDWHPATRAGDPSVLATLCHYDLSEPVDGICPVHGSSNCLRDFTSAAWLGDREFSNLLQWRSRSKR